MDYQVSRDDTMFGPYTEDELREYSISGNIVGTDLVRRAGSEKWTPLKKVLKKLDEQQKLLEAKEKKSMLLRMEGLRADVPSPPDMPWWLAAILDVATGLTFFVAWDIVEGVWMYRVQRESKALWYYLVAGAMFAVNAPAIYSTVMHDVFGTAATTSSSAGWLSALSFVVRIFARFSMRKSLLQHYNQAEPIGLKLSKFWTLLFGGLYFQYHFNRINEGKRAMEEAAAKAA
jgi:GYF domain 2